MYVTVKRISEYKTLNSLGRMMCGLHNKHARVGGRNYESGGDLADGPRHISADRRVGLFSDDAVQLGVMPLHREPPGPAHHEQERLVRLGGGLELRGRAVDDRAQGRRGGAIGKLNSTQRGLGLRRKRSTRCLGRGEARPQDVVCRVRSDPGFGVGIPIDRV